VTRSVSRSMPTSTARSVRPSSQSIGSSVKVRVAAFAQYASIASTPDVEGHTVAPDHTLLTRAARVV
jgi:hypothetical protein